MNVNKRLGKLLDAAHPETPTLEKTINSLKFLTVMLVPYFLVVVLVPLVPRVLLVTVVPLVLVVPVRVTATVLVLGRWCSRQVKVDLLENPDCDVVAVVGIVMPNR